MQHYMNIDRKKLTFLSSPLALLVLGACGGGGGGVFGGSSGGSLSSTGGGTWSKDR